MIKKREKRFSIYLILVICALVIGSVLLVSTILYSSLSKRMDEEFRAKAVVQASQIEQILERRLLDVRQRLLHLSLDNTIRVTMMLGAWQQLKEKLSKLYPPQKGTEFFVRAREDKKFYPEIPDYLPSEIKALIKKEMVPERVLKIGPKGKIYLIFSMSVKRRKELIGTSFCVLKLMREKELWQGIHSIADGDILIRTPDGWIDLKTGNPYKPEKGGEGFSEKERILSKIKGIPNLYYLVSFKTLKAEKRAILWMIITALSFVLVLALGVGVFLGRRMIQHLQLMAKDADMISQGKKGISFNEDSLKYIEFRQLARSFNQMLKGLREAQELGRYQELFEGVSDAIYITDLKGNILDSNKEASLRFGYPREKIHSMNLNNLLISRDASLFWRGLVKDGRVKFESLHRAQNGEKIPVEIHARTIQYRGEPGVISVLRDITERKISEAALKESQERFRTIAENAPFGISIINPDGRYEYINPGFTEIFGYVLEDIPAGSAWVEPAYPDPEYRKEVVATWINDLGDSKQGESRSRECKVSCKDGSQKTIYFRPVMLENGNQLVIYEDVTETRRLEAQLRHASKMEAVGTLAGGIAHDFNNLLQAITGYTEILLMGKEREDPDYHKLRHIQSSADRAGELIQQILTFSRKVESKLRPVNLNKEVEQVEKLLKRTIPKMIHIELNLEEDLKVINADSGQVEQVMMNLAVNARDAMPEGGELVIETENVTLGEQYSRTHLGIMPGEYVLLSVSDTGNGMDKETLEHIFEPFYTTKETGKGTGLGLAMVYGIVKSHNGYIMCYSEPGQGTTFKIYFPAIEGESKEQEPGPAKEKELPGGSETILLVDDEESLLSLGAEMLERFGYRVLTARDGEEALKQYREKRDEISLIILDLIMPGMGGKHCLEELLRMNPQIKVVIASGYSINVPTKEAIEVGAKGFIRKPYNIKQMLKVVREILDGVCSPPA